MTCAGITGTSGADGSFSIAGVRTVQTAIRCVGASIEGGVTRRGLSATVAAVRAGTTAVGDVVLAPVPIITSIIPKAIDALRPVASVQVTGINLSGAVFAFAPALQPPAITVGTAQTSADGTTAILPLTVAANARGRFTLVGTNAFGGADPTPTAGNTIVLINTQDDADSDGDGFPDGLELLFGSDPANATTVPDFTSSGQAMSAIIGITNVTPPNSDQSAVSAAFSLANRFVQPQTSQQLLGSAFSINNILLMPSASQELLSATFSLANTSQTALGPATIISSAFSIANISLSPATLQELLGPGFSVSNTSLVATTRVAIGPAVSILNANPLTAQTQQMLLQAAAPNPLISEARGLSVTIDQSVDANQLVAGQTITMRADAGGPEPIASVQFIVNGQTLATDPTSPYELLFTVPFGVDSLIFGALVTDTAGNRASADLVSVSVQPDPLTTIIGRVVDSAGNPVAGAVVDLLSDGLEVEFFEFAKPLTSLPDLSSRTPDRITRITAVNIRNPNGAFGADPTGSLFAPDYAERFTGWINVTTAGAHRFWLGAHEGARLKVAGVTIVDMPADTGAYQESSGAINLAPGLVPIEITHFEGAGNAELQLSLAPPGGERQVVPPVSFVPASQPFVAITDAAGTFTLRGVPTALDAIQVRVTVTSNSQNSSASSNLVAPVSGGVNVGDIVVTTQQR